MTPLRLKGKARQPTSTYRHRQQLEHAEHVGGKGTCHPGLVSTSVGGAHYECERTPSRHQPCAVIQVPQEQKPRGGEDTSTWHHLGGQDLVCCVALNPTPYTQRTSPAATCCTCTSGGAGQSRVASRALGRLWGLLKQKSSIETCAGPIGFVHTTHRRPKSSTSPGIPRRSLIPVLVRPKQA